MSQWLYWLRSTEDPCTDPLLIKTEVACVKRAWLEEVCILIKCIIPYGDLNYVLRFPCNQRQIKLIQPVCMFSLSFLPLNLPCTVWNGKKSKWSAQQLHNFQLFRRTFVVIVNAKNTTLYWKVISTYSVCNLILILKQLLFSFLWLLLNKHLDFKSKPPASLQCPENVEYPQCDTSRCRHWN